MVTIVMGYLVSIVGDMNKKCTRFQKRVGKMVGIKIKLKKFES